MVVKREDVEDPVFKMLCIQQQQLLSSILLLQKGDQVGQEKRTKVRKINDTHGDSKIHTICLN